MPFEPRVKEEVLQQMAGQVVAQSELTDLAEGGVLLTILGSIAEAIESTEFRLEEIRNSYDVNEASGVDLDERIADFPGTGLSRQAAAAASGAVLQVTRGTTTASLVLPAGSTFSRSDAPDLIYATVIDVTFAIGIATLDNVRVVCLTRGVIGNAPVGVIDRLVEVPDDITAVVQTSTLSGGVNRESDAELRIRARAYLSGLARCQPAALQSLALGFIDSIGTRIKHAFVLEDAEIPAYSELIIDDGTGLVGLVVPGVAKTGTISASGDLYLYHQSPAVDPITTITINGVPVTYNDPSTNPTWVSIPERGIVQLKDGQTDLSPGDTWSIGDAASPYSVYVGIIGELQAVIEGSSSDPTSIPGYRAAGTRVRVLPPQTVTIPVTVNLILETGVVVDNVVAAVIAEIEAFFLNLGPGDTLFLSQLYAQLQDNVPGVEAFNIIGLVDTPAPNIRTAFRAGTITVT